MDKGKWIEKDRQADISQYANHADKGKWIEKDRQTLEDRRQRLHSCQPKSVGQSPKSIIQVSSSTGKYFFFFVKIFDCNHILS